MTKIKTIFSKMNYSFIYCLPLAFAFAAAPYYIEEGRFEATPGYFLTVLLYFVCFVAADLVARLLLERNARAACKPENAMDRLLRKPVSVLIIGGIIFLFWLPSLIALYPGSVINDTWGQLKQYVDFQCGEYALYDHHPVCTTLIMGGFIINLQSLIDDWQLVFFIYVLIQALMTAMAFGVAVRYAYTRLEVGRGMAVLMLLFYGLMPLYPASVQTISKDALSAWMFVLFALMFMEAVRTEGIVLGKGMFLTGFTVLALVCALTKKVNVYVTLFSMIALLLFIRRNRFFVLIPMAVVAAVMFALLPWLFEKYGVAQGGKQEMFSLPFQQTARYVEENPDDITHEEYLVIDRLLDMSTLVERYNPVCADDVKGYWELGETDDYIRYIKVWAAQGLRHPLSYLSATNAMLAGWFSFEENDPIMDMESHSQLNPYYFSEYITWREEPFDKTAETYIELYNALWAVPVLGAFLTYGFYAVMVPLFSLFTTMQGKAQRRKRWWLALVPMFVSLVLGCFLAPLSIYGEGRRYLYPLTYTMPVMIAWCAFVYKDRYRTETGENPAEV